MNKLARQIIESTPWYTIENIAQITKLKLQIEKVQASLFIKKKELQIRQQIQSKSCQISQVNNPSPSKESLEFKSVYYQLDYKIEVESKDSSKKLSQLISDKKQQDQLETYPYKDSHFVENNDEQIFRDNFTTQVHINSQHSNINSNSSSSKSPSQSKKNSRQGSPSHGEIYLQAQIRKGSEDIKTFKDKQSLKIKEPTKKIQINTQSKVILQKNSELMIRNHSNINQFKPVNNDLQFENLVSPQLEILELLNQRIKQQEIKPFKQNFRQTNMLKKQQQSLSTTYNSSKEESIFRYSDCSSIIQQQQMSSSMSIIYLRNDILLEENNEENKEFQNFSEKIQIQEVEQTDNEILKDLKL